MLGELPFARFVVNGEVVGEETPLLYQGGEFV